MFLKRLFNFIPRNEFSKALNLFNSGQHRKALKKLEELQAVSERNDDVDRSTLDLYTCEAHVALAREHAGKGDIDRAIAEMECAVRLKPTFADLRYLLGTYYEKKGRFQAARDSFREALDINNKFFRARVHLSQTLRALGEYDKALDELDASRLSCPNFCRDALERLVGTLRADEGECTIEEQYRALLDERPSSAQISKELAIEAIQNGDCEEAIRELKKAIAINPDYPDLHNFLGIAYGNNGMVDDAVQEFEIALKINPYYLKARVNLALVYYENERYDEAREQIDQTLAIQPDNQLAINLLEELRAVPDRS